MRNCDWTEKVSLLIDGELGSEEANAVETHLGDCFACRMAREDFLLFRHRISSYQPDINLLAQREALRNILAAGRADNSTADPALASPAVGRRFSFAGLFALPSLNPGLVAASVLVLVCVVAGLLMLRGDSKPEQVATNPQTAPAPPSTSAPVASPERAGRTDGQGTVNSGVVDPTGGPGHIEVVKIRPKGVGSNELVKGFQPKGVGGTNSGDKYRPKGATDIDARAGREESAKLPREVLDIPFVIPPRVDVEALEFSEAEVASGVVTGRADAPTGLSTARHAEQAQNLLRSFRNASAADASDLAYERERSQELLYQNIVLRREAARGGKTSVEATLSQLETILLDIANLPEKPASEDVRSIKNRMERKNIVAMLQVAARD
ncbi:MAG TPA: zf-HC2 domain-containing protein [Pyrinomonadaceae bacterium]|nr:zf-HC2 domain-containing protein [Pyrinomonadaceae bacterium]